MHAGRKILMCGFGAFGKAHLAGWLRADPSIEIHVYDPSLAARSAAKASGITNIYDDLDQAIAATDIVDIVTPVQFHLPIALKALSQGKPVYLEKPAVLNIDEAKTLVEAVTASNGKIQVGYVLRAHPLTLHAQEILASGTLGKIHAIEGELYGYKKMRADSTFLENDGVHLLDLMNGFAAATPHAVSAVEHTLLGGVKSDKYDVSIAYENGIVGELKIGVHRAGTAQDPYVANALITKQIAILGNKGTLLLDYNTAKATLTPVTYTPQPYGWDIRASSVSEQHFLFSTAETVLEQSFRSFLNSVDFNAPIICNVEQGARDMTNLLAAIAVSMQKPSRIFTPLETMRNGN